MHASRERDFEGLAIMIQNLEKRAYNVKNETEEAKRKFNE